MSVDDIINKAKGDDNGDGLKDKSSPDSGSPVSKKGLSKGVSKDDVDVDAIVESGSEDVSDAEEEHGYPFPLTIMEQGGKGTGKSSDWASPDIPRPVGDETTHILTMSRETRTAIFDRWGGIPDYVNLVKLYEVYDGTQVESASEAYATVEVYLEALIESGDACNIVIDDMEFWYEEVAVNKCRHEFGLARGESLFGNASTDFWTRRKALGKDVKDLAMKAANHLLVMNGYDENVTKEMQEVDGQKQLVEIVEDPRWVKPFEKPFDITLLREKAETAESEDGNEGETIRTVKVLTSKANSLFPEGERHNVQGPGIAKFWLDHQARQDAQTHDLTDEDETTDDED